MEAFWAQGGEATCTRSLGWYVVDQASSPVFPLAQVAWDGPTDALTPVSPGTAFLQRGVVCNQAWAAPLGRS